MTVYINLTCVSPVPMQVAPCLGAHTTASKALSVRVFRNQEHNVFLYWTHKPVSRHIWAQKLPSRSRSLCQVKYNYVRISNAKCTGIDV